jgi:VCBS repeat-containing protein
VDISRKRFIEALAGGSALLVFGGCGGGGSYGSGNPPPAASGCTESISLNHGHALTIAVADLDSLTAKTYDIMGAAAHSHQVTFSTTQLQQLKAGTAVTVTSTAFSGDGHTHNVTATCVIM